jgi:hypothetical protein
VWVLSAIGSARNHSIRQASSNPKCHFPAGGTVGEGEMVPRHICGGTTGILEFPSDLLMRIFGSIEGSAGTTVMPQTVFDPRANC